MKLLVFLLLPCLSLSEVGTDFSKCKQFFLNGVPPQFTPSLSSTAHICQCLWYDDFQQVYFYATLYNTALRIPVYSAYLFKSAKTARCDPWYIEPQLDGVAGSCMRPQGNPGNPAIGRNQAVNPDYKDPDYDRGHLYPIQHTDNTLSMLATSTLTNAAPQDKSFNQGPWSVHEQNVTKALKDCNKTFVVTGVVPEVNIKIPKDNPRVTVSKYYWSATCCVRLGVFTGKGYYGPDNNGEVVTLSITELQKVLAKEYKVGRVVIFKGCN